MDDIDRIMAVMEAAFDPAFGEAWNRGQVENALLLGNCYYHLITPEGKEAQTGDTVAGFALLRQVLDEAELLLFAIAPDWRRRGLGDILLQKTTFRAKERGICTILLEMRRNNPAEFLYRKHSFRQIGVRPKYYRAIDGSRIDAITFERKLDAE
jgi:ribosomal-protein-alanine N-acetyltransferase